MVTNLLVRSLVIQLLPKQIQLLLLECLLTAYHMYNHAVIYTSIWIPNLSRDGSVTTKMQKTAWVEVKTATDLSWVAILWPMAHSLLQLRQHREQIFSHYRKHRC